MVQERSISNGAAEIDPVVMEFVREKVNSFIRWDLVRFFHDNPHTANTADNIARYIGREAEPVQAELVGLASANVLAVKTVSQRSIFSLSTDAAIRDIVHRFAIACDDPQFRVKAIHQVLGVNN